MWQLDGCMNICIYCPVLCGSSDQFLLDRYVIDGKWCKMCNVDIYIYIFIYMLVISWYRMEWAALLYCQTMSLSNKLDLLKKLFPNTNWTMLTTVLLLQSSQRLAESYIPRRDKLELSVWAYVHYSWLPN